MAISLLVNTVRVLTDCHFLVCGGGGSPGSAAAVPQALSLVLLFL